MSWKNEQDIINKKYVYNSCRTLLVYGRRLSSFIVWIAQKSKIRSRKQNPNKQKSKQNISYCLSNKHMLKLVILDFIRVLLIKVHRQIMPPRKTIANATVAIVILLWHLPLKLPLCQRVAFATVRPTIPVVYKQLAHSPLATVSIVTLAFATVLLGGIICLCIHTNSCLSSPILF